MKRLAILLLALALFGIFGGAVLVLTGAEGRVSTRLRQFVATDVPPPETDVAEMRRRKRADLFAQIDTRLERRASDHALALQLERANLSLTVSEFTLLRLGAGVVVALLLVVIAPGLWWAVALFTLAALARETSLVVPAACLLVGRRPRERLAMLVPFVVYGAWTLAVSAWLDPSDAGSSSPFGDATRQLALPVDVT